MATSFKLPELGENIKTIQVVKVLVAVGDTITVDQPVVELETDKATVEVPSNVGGKISAIHVKAGDDVSVGQSILEVEGSGGEATATPAASQPAAAPSPAPAAPAPAPVASAAAPAPAPAAVATGPVEVKLPELGENIKTIQVTRVLVKAGDRVEKDQPVVELETDKATVEVPSDASGTVREVRVKEGDDVAVGTTILVLDGATVSASAPAPTASTPAPAKPAGGTAAKAGQTASPAPKRATAPVPPPPPPVTGKRVPAAPSVRRFAREIGLDVNGVTGSGPHGRVSIEDVKFHAKALNENRAAAPAVAAPTMAIPDLPDFAKWGGIAREKMSGIRRKTAEHMALSWAQIPHVTIFDTADITNLEDLRKRFAPRAEEAGGKLTMGVIIVKIVAQALKRFPKFNASIDMTAREIVFKQYCNVGVAVDTERGLMVPVIRDADKKNMVQIAVELGALAEKARAGKITMAELEGGTFTVTNLGRTCGTFFTPIVNYPEVAILGVGRSYDELDAKTGKPKKVLPLSLSFDHRILDGAEGVRFLGWIIDALKEPLVLSLEG